MLNTKMTGEYKTTKIGKIPKDWTLKKIGQIGEAIIGLTYSPSDVVSNEDEGILVLRSSNIRESRIVYDDNIFVKKDIPDKLITKEGDILICSRNGSKDLIGKSAYIREKDSGKTFGAFMTVLRSQHSKYLFQLLQTNLYKKQIENNLGATINQITTKNLNSFIFPFPENPKEEAKIADILFTWDKAIELKEKLIEQKKELKKGLMQKLLNGEVRPFGSNSKVTKVRLKGLIKEIKLRNKNNKITRILSVTNSKGFIEQSEQFDRQVASKDLSNYKVVKYGQFAYNPSRVNVGSIDLLTKFEEGVLSPMYVVFTTVKEKLLPEYLYQFLKSKEFFNQIKSLLQGSVRQNLSFDALELIKLYVPNDLNEQKEIVKILSTADTEIALLEQELEALKQQKKGLMQLLLTGKVRVKV